MLYCICHVSCPGVVAGVAIMGRIKGSHRRRHARPFAPYLWAGLLALLVALALSQEDGGDAAGGDIEWAGRHDRDGHAAPSSFPYLTARYIINRLASFRGAKTAADDGETEEEKQDCTGTEGCPG